MIIRKFKMIKYQLKTMTIYLFKMKINLLKSRILNNKKLTFKKKII